MADQFDVAGYVAAHPGLTRRAVAQGLGGRLTTALTSIEIALGEGMVHARVGVVQGRGAHPRTVPVLHIGPGPRGAARALMGSLVTGAQLRETRTAVGITQAAIAMRLGISRARVAQWERLGDDRLPSWVVERLPVVVDQAQAAQLGREVSDVAQHRALTALLSRIRAHPGITEKAATAGGVQWVEALDQAQASGMVHRGRVFTRHGPQQGYPAVFLGPGPWLAPTPVAVADLLAARQRARWSRGQVAQRLGVARNTLAQWETRRNRRATLPTWISEAARSLMEDAGCTTSDRALPEISVAPDGAVWDRTELIGPVLSGDDVRALRERAGWSQATLARRLDAQGCPVSATGVSRWEAGGARPIPSPAVGAVARFERQVGGAFSWREEIASTLLATAESEPGLSRTALLRRAGNYSVHAVYAMGALQSLLDAGQVHAAHAGRRGVREGIYPGPAPTGSLLDADSLRKQRTTQRWTQAQLGERAGVPEWQVTHWETSKAPIPAMAQQALRQALSEANTETLHGENLAQAVLDAVGTGSTTYRVQEMVRAPRAAVAEMLSDLQRNGRLKRVRIGAGADDGRGRISRGRLGWVPGSA